MEAKLNEKNDISKFMWIYLNIISISAYMISWDKSLLANSSQVEDEVSVKCCKLIY